MLDFGDFAFFFKYRDRVMLKGSLCLLSSLSKGISFGMLVGARGVPFCAHLQAQKCFTGDGESAIGTLVALLYCSLAFSAVSGTFSLINGVLSAMYGGKLTGLPVVL